MNIKKFLKKLRTKKIMAIKEKQHEEFKKIINNAFKTLKWIEKQLPNRKARKQFYYDVCHNGFVHSKYVELFMDRYLEKDEVSISRKEYDDLKNAKIELNSLKQKVK